MAGKMQLAAKLFLGTTFLASGGGVYYVTSHGLPLPGFNQNAQSAATDLDAVASAWSQSAPTRNPDAMASPSARSAATTSPDPSKSVAKSSSDDRYAVPATAPTPAVMTNVADDKDVTKAHTQKNRLPLPQPDSKPRVKLASHSEVNNGDDEIAPTPAKAAAGSSIARGQEPKDDGPTPIQVKGVPSEISGRLDETTKSSRAAGAQEPRQLPAPPQQVNGGEAASRARQAFGNGPSSASGDRYDNALPPATVTIAEKSAAIDPFGSSPAPSPPSNSKSDRIERLQGAPNDIGGALRELQPGGELQPPDASATARAANRDFAPQDRTPRTSPFDSTPGAGIGSPLSPANAGPTGPGDMLAQPMAGDGTGKPGEKALEGPQQPTLVIQKFAPGEIQVGKPAKFVLQVRNAGGQAADNVTIQDEIPQGTQLISTSPNAKIDASRLVWQLGKLSPGEDRTVEMQVMPKAEGEIGSVATVTYSAQASVKSRCTMPQLAIRMTAPSEVMIGNQQHVKIEIRNPGSGDATGVMLFENVPPNVKHVAGPALEFEIGTLRAGETRELDLVLTAEKAGKVINTLTARAHGNLQVQQQVEFEVIAPALTVAVQGPDRRYLERPATYEVSVENPGTAPAHDVQIVTKLPKGMRFVKANNMGEYDASSHAVYWSLAELPKGERGTVELTAVPVETGPQTLQVESRAKQGLADTIQREVLVEGIAAVRFEVRALQDPIEVGGETGYEIRVVNQGTKAATNVQVSAELPAGLKFISAEGETQHKADRGRIVFEPIQQLAPKADTVVRIRAQGVQPGDQRVIVEVKTDDLEHPIHREESTRVFGD